MHLDHRAYICRQKQAAALKLAAAELQHLPHPLLRCDLAQCRSSRLPKAARPPGRTQPPPGQCSNFGSATPGAKSCRRRSSSPLRRPAQVSRGQPSQVGLCPSICMSVSGVKAGLLVQHKTAWLNSMACHCSSALSACSAPSIDAMHHCCLTGLSRYAMDFQVGGACRACSILLHLLLDLPQCAAVLLLRFDLVPAVQHRLPDECRRSEHWERGAMASWWQPSTGDHSNYCKGRRGCKPLRGLHVVKALAGRIAGAIVNLYRVVTHVSRRSCVGSQMLHACLVQHTHLQSASASQSGV